MNEPTIGQRLWHELHDREFTVSQYHNYASPAERANYERIAVSFIRCVLTGEIPLPDELGPAAVQFIKAQELDEYRNFQAWMQAAVESGATSFGHHIPDVTK